MHDLFFHYYYSPSWKRITWIDFKFHIYYNFKISQEDSFFAILAEFVIICYHQPYWWMFSKSKKDNKIPIQLILLEIAYLAAMPDGDILFINRPLAAYISLGKVVLRMRRKNSRARSETTNKRAGSRHWGSKLSQPTVHVPSIWLGYNSFTTINYSISKCPIKA